MRLVHHSASQRKADAQGPCPFHISQPLPGSQQGLPQIKVTGEPDEDCQAADATAAQRMVWGGNAVQVKSYSTESLRAVDEPLDPTPEEREFSCVSDLDKMARYVIYHTGGNYNSVLDRMERARLLRLSRKSKCQECSSTQLKLEFQRKKQARLTETQDRQLSAQIQAAKVGLAAPEKRE